MALNQFARMFLLNYFVEHGSFANLSKRASGLYKRILQEKKEEEHYSEFLERELLPHRVQDHIDPKLFKHLRDFYAKETSLSNKHLPKAFESALTELAEKLDYKVDDLKHYLDNNMIFPETMVKIKRQFDVPAYNSLLSALALSILLEARNNPKRMNIEKLRKAKSFEGLRSIDPKTADYLSLKIPTYSGSSPDPSVKIKLEGSKYFGVDLHLNTLPNILDDILYCLKGYMNNINLTPLVAYKLRKMVEVTGNLNRIGLDNMNLIADLDYLAQAGGFSTIKALLEGEGYTFTPISHEHANIIPCGKNYELILDDYEEGQILLDNNLKKPLEDLGLKSTLGVGIVNYMSENVHLLNCMYKGQVMLVHSLITKKNELKFKDRNTLNLLTANLI